MPFLQDLINKIKGKKKIDVKDYYRTTPKGIVTKVEHYTRYIENDDETPTPEELNPDLEVADPETDEDYADKILPVDEIELTPLEKAALPKIEPSELPVLIKAWKTNKDEQAIERIINTYQGILYFHANKYKTAPIPYDFLVLEAKRLLLKAVETYDPSKKAAFNTHLTNYLKKLYRFVGDNQNIAKIPEQRIRKINRFQMVRAQLEDKLGRLPTEAELADELSWNIKEVNRLKKELDRAEITEFGSDYSYADLGVKDEKLKRALKLIYFDASADERFVLEHTTNISGDKQLTITEIAKKLRLPESKVKYIIAQLKQKIIENA